jgi:hypothetical protein
VENEYVSVVVGGVAGGRRYGAAGRLVWQPAGAEGGLACRAARLPAACRFTATALSKLARGYLSGKRKSGSEIAVYGLVRGLERDVAS